MIPAYADLNDYLTPGMYAIYTVVSGETIKHMPVQTAGILKVYTATGAYDMQGSYIYIKQEFYPYVTFNKYGRTCYTYGSSTVTFSEWQKIY